jgi:hypothetical protein
MPTTAEEEEAELSAFLKYNKVEKYHAVLREGGVRSLAALAMLDEDRFRQLGVLKGARVKILNTVAGWQTSEVAAEWRHAPRSTLPAAAGAATGTASSDSGDAAPPPAQPHSQQLRGGATTAALTRPAVGLLRPPTNRGGQGGRLLPPPPAQLPPEPEPEMQPQPVRKPYVHPSQRQRAAAAAAAVVTMAPDVGTQPPAQVARRPYMSLAERRLDAPEPALTLPPPPTRTEVAAPQTGGRRPYMPPAERESAQSQPLPLPLRLRLGPEPEPEPALWRPTPEASVPPTDFTRFLTPPPPPSHVASSSSSSSSRRSSSSATTTTAITSTATTATTAAAAATTSTATSSATTAAATATTLTWQQQSLQELTSQWCAECENSYSSSQGRMDPSQDMPLWYCDWCWAAFEDAEQEEAEAGAHL